MATSYNLTDGVSVLPAFEPVPGFGFLPINTYILKGEQNILVDTGLEKDEEDLLRMIEAEVGPDGLDWILLSHADRDHSGNLKRLLQLYPRVKVVTNFTTVAKVSAETDLPFTRVFAVNAGQTFTAGDRTLQIFQPPLYDSGGSVGFYDAKSGVLFGADSFGAIIPEQAVELDDVPAEPFGFGFSLFNRANTPWVLDVDVNKFASTLKQVADFQPKIVVATHIPAARGRTDELLQATAALTSLGPAPVPDQAALEAMLAQMTGAAV